MHDAAELVLFSVPCYDAAELFIFSVPCF